MALGRISAIKAMEERVSVRNFTDQPIEQDVLNEIEMEIKDTESPFPGHAMIHLIKRSDFKGEVSFGSYGFVSGGEYFLVGTCGKNKEDDLTLGYIMEKVVIYCTSLGLSSVWLGGSFRKKDFENLILIPEGQDIRVVIPIGYEGGQKTMMAKFIETVNSRRDKRKEFEELFFEESFDKPMDKNEAGSFAEALRMVRIAPSAMNKQPWRVIVSSDAVDFYLSENGDFSWIDMGIALSHFEMALTEDHVFGSFTKKENKEDHKFTYITSFDKFIEEGEKI